MSISSAVEQARDQRMSPALQEGQHSEKLKANTPQTPGLGFYDYFGELDLFCVTEKNREGEVGHG